MDDAESVLLSGINVFGSNPAKTCDSLKQDDKETANQGKWNANQLFVPSATDQKSNSNEEMDARKKAN